MWKKIVLALILILVLSASGFLSYRYQQAKDWSFYYDPGDKFVTDIADSKRVIGADLVIRMSDSRREAYLAENNQRIRNTVVFILRAKTEAELKSRSIEATLNEEILDRLNDEFDSDEFVQVYFNEFVVH
jgi:flagellar basal body-associated protein FliL